VGVLEWRVEGGGEVGAEVGDGVKDEIDVGVGMMLGVELVMLLDLRLEFVMVMEFVQVGAVFKLGWLKSLDVQVRVYRSGCCDLGFIL
jgi:hypothetical protein